LPITRTTNLVQNLQWQSPYGFVGTAKTVTVSPNVPYASRITLPTPMDAKSALKKTTSKGP